MKIFTSKDYLEILKNSYSEHDLSMEDFENTLIYFAELHHKERIKPHLSDCSLHNEPFMKAGKCDCRLDKESITNIELK